MDAFIGFTGIVLIMVIFPIMGIMLVIKAIKKTATNTDIIKTFSILGIGIAMFIIAIEIIPSDYEERQEIEKQESEISKDTEKDVVEEETDNKKDNLQGNPISYSEDSYFLEAINKIGMDYSDVKNIQRLDDWASGKRFSFVNNGFTYIVYELDNGETSSINTQYKRTAIYERGYEPLYYKNFEPNKDYLAQLQDHCLKKMINYIDGETSLEIVYGSTMYDRIYDMYYIYGEVEAKNRSAKEVYTFAADYLIDKDGYECKHIAINGTTVFGNEEIPEITKTEIISSETSGNNEVVVLSDGKQGDYGRYDDFDGEEYLRYYVPSGKYSVKCNVRGGFYIETIELHKEDGWDTATTISQNMMQSGEEIEIIVEDGQCISLIINTEIELKKMQ